MRDPCLNLPDHDTSRMNTPEVKRRSSDTQRANASIKHALLNAFDKLGNEAFFVELARGHAAYAKLPPALAARLLAEDRRCLAMILAKLLPIEVAGALDATLTVKVVTMVGDQEIDITRARKIPKDAARPAVPGPVPLPLRVPEEVTDA